MDVARRLTARINQLKTDFQKSINEEIEAAETLVKRTNYIKLVNSINLYIKTFKE